MSDDYNLDKNKTELAAEMSGGNIYLKNDLLIMWENNMNVIGCSTGNKKEKKYPYISIVIDKNSVNLINDMYDDIFKYMKQYVQVNFVNDFLEDGKHRFIMNISVKNEYANVLFGLIYKTITESKGKEFVQNDIVASILHLLNLFSLGKCEFRLSISQDKMYISIGDTQTSINDAFLNLKDVIPLTREKRTIKYGTYKCDNESLMALASIMYEANKGFQKRKDKK